MGLGHGPLGLRQRRRPRHCKRHDICTLLQVPILCSQTKPNQTKLQHSQFHSPVQFMANGYNDMFVPRTYKDFLFTQNILWKSQNAFVPFTMTPVSEQAGVA